MEVIGSWRYDKAQTNLRLPKFRRPAQRNEKMIIGEPQRVIVVEPLELPISKPEHTEPGAEPAFVPEPKPEPERVPAR
jgi:hypothetical protein